MREKKQNGATFSVGQSEMAIIISPLRFFFFFVDTFSSTSIDIELSKLKRTIFPNPKYELNMCVFRLFQVPWHFSYHPERKHLKANINVTIKIATPSPIGVGINWLPFQLYIFMCMKCIGPVVYRISQKPKHRHV